MEATFKYWWPGAPLHPVPFMGYSVEPPAALGLGLGLGKKAYGAKRPASWAILLNTADRIFTVLDRNVTSNNRLSSNAGPIQQNRLAELLI